MLRKRINKNILKLNKENDPVEQRLSYVKEILKDSTFFPKTVNYRDIDETFVKWVEDELKIVYEEKVLPTYALFSNQRYSEYMQMWDSVDEKNNIMLNFKVITRENNPQDGNLYKGAGLIPTNSKYLMNRTEGLNDEGKLCTIEYRMSQPLDVDFSYKITIVTNKYELLNKFNMLIHDKFSSLQAYVFPNGHPMPMKLQNVSDESDYTVDDRQYFAQSYTVTLMGYVLTEDDFEIEVKPIVSFQCIGGDVNQKKPQVEIEEFEIINSCPIEKEGRYYNKPLKITINFDKCDSEHIEFVIDCNMYIEKIYGENIRTWAIKLNDDVIFIDECGYEVKENDKITVKIKKVNNLKPAVIYFDGFDSDVIYDRKNDDPESMLDFKNYSEDIIIQ